MDKQILIRHKPRMVLGHATLESLRVFEQKLLVAIGVVEALCQPQSTEAKVL